jgi:hypothetical protein
MMRNLSVEMDMIRNLSEEMDNMIKERCELCSSSFHSTISCPFELCERNGGATLESNNYESDTQMQVEEQSTTLDVGYKEDFDSRCDFTPTVQVEQNKEEPKEVPNDIETPMELYEPKAVFPVWNDDFGYSGVLEEDYFDDHDSFFDDEEGNHDEENAKDDSAMALPSMLESYKSSMLGLETPCISFPTFSYPDVLNLHDEPSLEPEIGAREYSEYVFNKGGSLNNCFCSYCKYFKKPPLMLNLFEHIPFHENWTHKFDKLKRFLNGISFVSGLSLCYLCFYEISSQGFDRLLRALTMSDCADNR